MNRGLIKTIRPRMEMKDTQELLRIWKKHDTSEWSEEAFQAVAEVLKERGIVEAHLSQYECSICGNSDFEGVTFQIVCAEVVRRRHRKQQTGSDNKIYRLLETRPFFACEQCVRAV